MNFEQQGWGEIAALPSAGRFALLTIDTEEIFDWSAGKFAEWSVPPLSALEQLQSAAEAHGFTPLYFTTYPLLADDDLGSLLARWVSEGRADVGLHLHSWATPPRSSRNTDKTSFQCNLDPALHREKLANLAKLFTERIGQQPVCHRAGRYGISPWVLDQLAEIGVLMDFSPSSGFDFRQGEGPDFFDFPINIRRRTTSNGDQWIFPVSGARKWRRLENYPRLPSESHGPLRNVLDFATTPVRLSPEGHTLEQLKNLTTALLARNTQLLTPSLHITSLVADATPYSHDEAGVDRLISTLVGWMTWAPSQDIKPVTLRDIARMIG